MLGVAYLTAINDESTQVVSIIGKDESFEDGTARLLGYATVAELEQFFGGAGSRQQVFRKHTGMQQAYWY